MTAYGWRATSNNTAKLACSPLKHACGIIMSPLLPLADIPELPINVRFWG